LADGHCAEDVDVDVAVTTDQRDEPWHVAAIYVTGQQGMHPFEPRFRKPFPAHAGFLASVDRIVREVNLLDPNDDVSVVQASFHDGDPG
jgi:hypothetical protein